jgi:hypothetical protein
MTRPTEQARGLLDDLLNIEVDVIIASDVDRGVMPPPTGDDAETAIREVLDGYIGWLDDHEPEIGVTAAESVPRPSGGELSDELEWLGARVARAEERTVELMEAAAPLDAGVPTMLRRIRGNAAQLGAVASGEVSEPVDRTRIVRKAWEVGTDTIVAQTVVQLDGDVVERVDEESFLGPRRERLRSMHATATRGALENWRVLFDLVLQLVMSAGQLVHALWPPSTGIASLRRRWREWGDRRRSGPDGEDREEHLKVTDLFRKETRARVRSAWTDFRETAVALIVDGGATIETPGERPISARTVIQPDGDAMWFVREDVADDPEHLDAHAAHVAAWYRRSGLAVGVVQQVVAALQRVATTFLAVIWAALTVLSGIAWGWWALAVAVIAAVVGGLLLLVARAGLGRWIRKAVRSAGR